jgi:hypothetical protein
VYHAVFSLSYPTQERDNGLIQSFLPCQENCCPFEQNAPVVINPSGNRRITQAQSRFINESFTVGTNRTLKYTHAFTVKSRRKNSLGNWVLCARTDWQIRQLMEVKYGGPAFMRANGTMINRCDVIKYLDNDWFWEDECTASHSNVLFLETGVSQSVYDNKHLICLDKHRFSVTALKWDLPTSRLCGI